MIPDILGLTIGKSSPLPKASAKKFLFKSSLFGKPKEIFDTPKRVFKPSSCLTSSNAFNVSLPLFPSEDTGSTNVSINTSSFFIPYSRALLSIFLAIFTLSSAVSGIPLLSKVSPTTAAPYFFTKGSILSNTSSSPLTEFKIGFPL